ncbi:hypothetical protein EDC40_101145 [Aminobacter aminovorans]|uniref:Uncharacterized protein n=1 Tax=Aminobacter aminovorans TaxID=83263 RepID=A0A380WNX0_AMIAI|nr:hypothetical protein [Aminobacter aminovorans]TCS29830.1 hypothetical protein EDC40_101145 [Aminobacter aminovorans]SUU90679.1 Uncharacterised protein [Aminobacter aminovorans]
MDRIIYPIGDGVAVVIPAEKSGLPVEEIARKDVPAGVPFKIVAAADIPVDRSLRGLWTADFSNPDGVGIGIAAWFAEHYAIDEAAHADEMEDSK